MSDITVPQTAEKKPSGSWEMLRSMGGIGLMCGLLIVFVYQATLPVIERNKAEALGKAVFHVLPGATSRQTFKLTAEGAFEKSDGKEKNTFFAYAGYDDQHQLVGIAIVARGQGFQDAVHLIYGYSPHQQTVIGFQVLESKETPGLGSKIETDHDFLKNFAALDVSLNESGTVKNPIVPVKHGEKQNPWEIECITGATISSKAVSKIFEQSTEKYIPLVIKNLQTFMQ